MCIRDRCSIDHGGHHPMPDDSHGACSLPGDLRNGASVPGSSARQPQSRVGRNAPRRCRLNEQCPRSMTAFATCDPTAAARICDPKLSTPHAPCDLFRTCGKGAHALYRKWPIRDLSPSACLPFQARGKVLDRPLAAVLIEIPLQRDWFAMKLRTPKQLR